MKKLLLVLCIALFSMHSKSQNLLQNGEFNLPISTWMLSELSPARGYYSIVNGEAKFSLIERGTEPWHVQLTQLFSSLTQGVSYRLSFDISADSNSYINVALINWIDPWNTYVAYDSLLLTPETKHYEFVFTMPESYSNTMQISFDFGTYELVEITLDNVYLVQNNGFAGPDKQICPGSTAVITASGYTNYTWSNGSTSALALVSPAITTTYTVTGSNDIETVTDQVIVTVNAVPTVNAGTDQAVLEGHAAVLSATGGFSYQWDNGATIYTTTVYPLVATTYTVTAMNVYGCTASDEVVVSITPPSSQYGWLVNDTNWTKNNTSYRSSVNATLGYDNTQILDNVTVCGTSYCRWSSTASNGWVIFDFGQDYTLTEFRTYNDVQANQQPKDCLFQYATSLTGPWMTLSTYTCNNTGGAWEYFPEFSATTSRYWRMVVNTSYGTRFQIAEVGFYGAPASSTPVISISGKQTICRFESTQLTANGAGTEGTYIWNTGATSATLSVNPIITTTYTVTGTNSLGHQGTASVVVTVNPLPTALAGADLSIQAGNSASLTASGGISYLWSNGATSAMTTVAPQATTTYTVTVTSSAGCTSSDNIVVTVSAAPCSVSLNQGLVTRFDFNGNADDLSGNGNNGTVSGSALTNDRFSNANSAYSFNGTSNYISFSNKPNISQLNKFTISKWIYLKDATSNQIFFLNSNGPNSADCGFITRTFSGNLSFEVGNGSLTQKVTISNANYINKWTHLLCSYDSLTLKMYINGQLVKSLDYSLDIKNTTAGYNLGYYPGGYGQYLNGYIDDLRIYDHALSSCEIDSLYNLQNPASIPCVNEKKVGLVARYDFSGNASDVSGNGLNGTVYNATLTTDRFGNTSSAYDFSGSTSSYINIPDNSQLHIANEISISMWVYRTRNTSVEGILCKGRDVGNSYSFMFNAGGGTYGVFRAQTGTGNSNTMLTPKTVDLNKWVHLVFTVDATKQVQKLFVDGVMVTEKLGYTFDANNTYPIQIGRHIVSADGTGSGYAFKGKVDDLMIFNRALENCEVDSLFSLPNPAICGLNDITTGINAKYDFTGSANDLSGHAVHGTVSGATLTNDRFGKPESAYIFDGVNDYIALGNSSYLQSPYTTIAFWFKANTINSAHNIMMRSLFNGYTIRLASDGKLAFDVWDGLSTNVSRSSSTPMNDDKWHFGVFSYGSDSIRFYIDNIKLQSIKTVSTGIGYNGGNVGIGRDGSNNLYFYKGILDDVVIYNRSLSLCEIDSLYYLGGYDPASQFICGDTVVDATTGESYPTILVGDRCWMNKNLMATHYANGEIINDATNIDLCTMAEPKYSAYHSNSLINAEVYGRLYTWYAATDSRGLCPTGWQVPTLAEWDSLVTDLGGETIAGGAMKETGTTHWSSPNTGATNASGFSALGGGFRNCTGVFNTLKFSAYFWSSTENDSTTAWFKYLTSNSASIISSSNSLKSQLNSVRCIKSKESLQNIVLVTTAGSVCKGNAINVTASGAGTGGTYVWSNGATSSQFSVSPTITTTYTVTATASSGATGTAQAVVTVNAVPIITATGAFKCGTTSVTISADGAGTGGTYIWSNGLGSGQTKSVNPTVATTYTVTGTTTNTCINTAEAVVLINATPTPTIAGGGMLCKGNSTTLIAGGAGAGGSYYWNNGKTTSIISISPTVNTVYSVTAITSCGLSNSAEVAMTVVNVPTKPVITIKDDTLFSSVSSNNQWLLNSNTIEDALLQYYKPIESGVYRVKVTNIGCSSISDSVQVVISSIENYEKQQTQIYPNPVYDKLMISCNRDSYSTMYVYNLLGELSMKQAITEIISTIDVSLLPAGMYVIELIGTKQAIRQKIIKE